MMHKYVGTQNHSNTTSDQKIPVAVVGSSGYAGLELIRLLMKHPNVELRACFSTQSSFSLSDYIPMAMAKGIPIIPLSEIGDWAKQLKTIFLATPTENSMELAPVLLEAGAHVIDLSGAFRLKEGSLEDRLKNFEQWYQMKHTCPELLDRAEYGLSPWIGELPGLDPATAPARLIANPGCYATSVLMAVLPPLQRNLINPDTLVIDAKSGTSGAGKKASERLLFTEVDGECLPYRVGRHQHMPEIAQYSHQFAGVPLDPSFTTHLLNVRRGIIAGMYARLNEGVTAEDIDAAYANTYSDYELVDWSHLDSEDTRSNIYNLSLKRIVGSAFTKIHYQVVGNRLYLFSLIDNLIKGAAGQAIENFNRIHHLKFETSLVELEGVL